MEDTTNKQASETHANAAIQKMLRDASKLTEELRSSGALQALENVMKQLAEFQKLTKTLERTIVNPRADYRTSAAFEYIKRVMSDPKTRMLRSSELVKAQNVETIGIEPKSIYNTLNYLANRGELQRVSRGRYRIVSSGVGVETSAEFDKLEEPKD